MLRLKNGTHAQEGGGKKREKKIGQACGSHGLSNPRQGQAAPTKGMRGQRHAYKTGGETRLCQAYQSHCSRPGPLPPHDSLLLLHAPPHQRPPQAAATALSQPPTRVSPTTRPPLPPPARSTTSRARGAAGRSGAADQIATGTC